MRRAARRVTGLFSLVVPTYNVERYLDDFLASLAAQTFSLRDLEILFVDDGSTDSSAEIITDWIKQTAPAATLLRQENGGLSAARNAGLERVTGSWVTFCDPDDTLAPDYFANVARFLAGHGGDDVDLIACRLLMLDDRTGRLTDTHPLRFRFARGNRVVDLEREPRYIHLSAATGFYRTDRIAELGLRFDGRIRPNFEDGHFTARYLAHRPRPRVGFVRDAVYHYRRRDDDSSLVQDSWLRPEKLTEIPRYGHLDLLERAARRGAVPVWLQNMVLYDLTYVFKYDEQFDSPLAAVDPATADRFHELLPAILEHIDTATIEDYRVAVASPDIRNALIIGGKGERTRPDRVRIERVDADQRLALLRYYFGGEPPAEQFRCDGGDVIPIYGKTRTITFLGRRMASERIAWLPAQGAVEITLDGRPTPIALGDDIRGRLAAEPTRRWRRLAAVSPSSPYADAPRPRRPVLERGRNDWYWALRRRSVDGYRRLQRAATWIRGGRQVRRYRDAWVFVAGAGAPGDDALVLFQYVTEQQPEINAWLVADRNAPAWTRLAGLGVPLVPMGSREHTLLMLGCAELVTSRLDDDAIAPLDRRRYGPGRWRLTYLPPDVPTSDVSRWVNRAPISRYVTASEAERRAIVGDDTPYVLSDKEVALTGLPRHDRLLRLAGDPEVRSAGRLVLIVPTRHGAGGDGWLELLRSERLAELSARAAAKVAVAPGPEISASLADASLPAHVELCGEGGDIQTLFARAAVLITDDASAGFELGYLERPVIYFGVGCAGSGAAVRGWRRGDWTAERDGFGPAAERSTAVLDELKRLIDAGMAAGEPYSSRMAEAFPFRDGRCCERVFASILAARRPPLGGVRA